MEWWLQAATQTQGASAAVSLRLMSAHIPCKPFVMDANGFAELRKFMASYSTAHAFVIKPATMGEGKGVFAVDSAEEAEAVLTKLSQQQQKQQQQQQQQQHWQAHTYVVSPLLNNPLLVHGHKVDLRCYVLLKGTASALHANMLNDCLVRFALDAYDPSAHRGGRRTQWMTNTYLSQHKLEDSSQHEQRQRSQQSQQQRQQQQQPRGDGRGHEAFGGAVWRLQQLADHLVHTGDTDLLAALRSSELGMDQRRKGTTKHSKQKTGRRRGGRQHGPGAIFNEDELQQASVYEELLRRAASSIRPVLLAAQLQAQDAAAAAAAAAAANGRSGRGGRTAQDSSLGKKNSGGNGDSARQGRSTLKGDACKHCFQLLGVDVFVSSALEMHVIEVNGLPSMSQHIDDAQYRALKHTLLHTTLDTLGVCPRRHAPPASSWHQHDTAPSSPSSSSSPSRLLVSGTNEGMLPLLPVHGKHNARAGEWIVPLSAQERDMLSKLRQ
ncbi:hypothetical protein, variant [Salpingoeca rosetta]|nr:hypothetical protein, variant [Salpingoeca rosetta]EGD78737.1 hypothetical protein, variant [Salpingoeca rosetta]|eukprot:XP_004997694.1 hypothetical protein, variant [Salpingoeca rosetta]